MKLNNYLISFIWTLQTVFGHDIQNAAVTLIVDTENNIKEILCPRFIYAERSDFLQNSKVVSFFKASFYCDIVLINDKLHVDPPYHISVRPLFNASRIGCKSFDSCYNLDITQIKATNFRFNIEGSVPCLEEVLKFLFKLQKRHFVVHTTVTEMFVGKKPPIPSNLTYQFVNNEITLQGDFVSICSNVFKVSKYYAKFSFSLGHSHLVTKKNICQVNFLENAYKLQCKILNLSGYIFYENSVCDFTLLTKIFGINKNMSSVPLNSIYFSNIEKMNSTDMIYLQKTFSSVVIGFRKDKYCSRKQSINLVVHVKGIKNDVNDIFTNGCQQFDACQINLKNLLPGSSYNICIHQQEVFQNTFGKSKKICKIFTTLRFPCVKSHIVNITKKAISSEYWQVIVYMQKQCKDPEVFSVVQVIENNNTIVFNETFPFNTYYKSKGTIKNLDFTKQYNLKIMSCNVHKCKDHIEEIYLSPPIINKDLFVNENKNKQNVTPILNLILITISLLVLAIVLVYFIYFLCTKNDKFNIGRQSTVSLNVSIPENSTLV